MSPLEVFFRDCKAALKRITAHARGDVSLEDVKNEAWVLTEELSLRGNALDLTVPAHQETLIRKLYGKFVKRMQTRIGFALRLDKDWDRQGEEGYQMLGDTLAAPELSDPLLALEQREDPTLLEITRNQSYSQATAYALCLNQWSDLKSFAQYLGITVGTLRIRVKRWAAWAEFQPSLFDGIECVALDFLPLRGRSLAPASRASLEGRQYGWSFDDAVC